MKVLLDVQLPPSLKRIFEEKGHDCIHTLDLQLGNDTPDKIINALSVLEERVVVTKDSDFYDRYLLKKEPYKLVLVKLGNTSKQELLYFFQTRFASIIEQISQQDLLLFAKRCSLQNLFFHIMLSTGRFGCPLYFALAF